MKNTRLLTVLAASLALLVGATTAAAPSAFAKDDEKCAPGDPSCNGNGEPKSEPAPAPTHDPGWAEEIVVIAPPSEPSGGPLTEPEDQGANPDEGSTQDQSGENEPGVGSAASKSDANGDGKVSYEECASYMKSKLVGKTSVYIAVAVSETCGGLPTDAQLAQADNGGGGEPAAEANTTWNSVFKFVEKALKSKPPSLEEKKEKIAYEMGCAAANYLDQKSGGSGGLCFDEHPEYTRPELGLGPAVAHDHLGDAIESLGLGAAHGGSRDSGSRDDGRP